MDTIERLQRLNQRQMIHVKEELDLAVKMLLDIPNNGHVVLDLGKRDGQLQDPHVKVEYTAHKKA